MALGAQRRYQYAEQLRAQSQSTNAEWANTLTETNRRTQILEQSNTSATIELRQWMEKCQDESSALASARYEMQRINCGSGADA